MTNPAVRLELEVQRGWALSPLSAHFLGGSLDVEKWRHPPHPRGGEDSQVASDEDPQVTGTAARGQVPRDGTWPRLGQRVGANSPARGKKAHGKAGRKGGCDVVIYTEQTDTWTEL